MGGDQVYPTASGQAYEDRFRARTGPRCRRRRPASTAPTLYALPGNHDWYDGLTAFLRLFARREGAHIGGWQHRADPQLLRAEAAAPLVAARARRAVRGLPRRPAAGLLPQAWPAQIEPGDRVILCTPQPSWVADAESTRAYDTHRLLPPQGDRRRPARRSRSCSPATCTTTRATRRDGDAEQLITSGGGGAYLAATHDLPEQITVPPQAARRCARDARRRDYSCARPTRPRLARGARQRRLLPAAAAQPGLRHPARRACTRCCCSRWTTRPGQSAASRMPDLPHDVDDDGRRLFFAVGLSARAGAASPLRARRLARRRPYSARLWPGLVPGGRCPSTSMTWPWPPACWPRDLRPVGRSWSPAAGRALPA